ncbi:hypothetical protein EMEDMD4_240122 [Sinorhizobium medicae]|uniref:Uncharacterized protein n=1 Tax=Sinorhizobium medicae TaxID=110321 RepID=A0A508WWK9_9HYPH|nr:hypothetical protein EMEDMD4_240122 [Sinorhizobium medicae]
MPTRLANSTRAGEFTACRCNAPSCGDSEVVASVIGSFLEQFAGKRTILPAESLSFRGLDQFFTRTGARKGASGMPSWEAGGRFLAQVFISRKTDFVRYAN